MAELPERLILVTGATGRQGGSVARHLLAEGWPVRAFVRDPGTSAVQALVRQGAEIVVGDLEDRDSIDAALADVCGVYSVQSWAAGVEAEVRQGIALAEASAAAGVEHFVYSSVGGADRRSGVPHFESKWRIEQRIRELDLAYTIWRPAYFMENLLWQKEAMRAGRLTPPLDPAVPLQFIAVEDVGAFVALSFKSPGAWLGKCTEIAGDELSFAALAEVLTRAMKHPVELQPVIPPAEAERRDMMRWLETQGYQADIGTLRRLIPELTDLETWAGIMLGCLAC